MEWLIEMTLIWIVVHYVCRAIDWCWRANKQHQLRQQQQTPAPKPEPRPYNFMDYKQRALV